MVRTRKQRSLSRRRRRTPHAKVRDLLYAALNLVANTPAAESVHSAENLKIRNYLVKLFKLAHLINSFN